MGCFEMPSSGMVGERPEIFGNERAKGSRFYFRDRPIKRPPIPRSTVIFGSCHKRLCSPTKKPSIGPACSPFLLYIGTGRNPFQPRPTK
jgi:hypothetical protein